jgi:hypothetical protein
MPIKSGTSKATFEDNLKKLLSEGYPKDQALAIAYNAKKKSQKGKK